MVYGRAPLREAAIDQTLRYAVLGEDVPSKPAQQAWRATGRSTRHCRATSGDVLRGAPVVTVSSAAELIGRSYVQTNQAIQRLADADILKQVNVGRRNRAYEAPEIIGAFTDLERQFASPEGNTRTSQPSRPVPRRGSLSKRIAGIE